MMRVVDGQWRLGMSRALTSPRWLSAGVSDVADTFIWRLHGDGTDLPPPPLPADRFNSVWTGGAGYAMVVATDGIWGVLSNEDAARHLASCWGKGLDAGATAEMLCARATAGGSSDNMSLVVYFFDRPLS